jgi:hypothetical protein
MVSMNLSLVGVLNGDPHVDPKLDPRLVVVEHLREKALLSALFSRPFKSLVKVTPGRNLWMSAQRTGWRSSREPV